MDARRLVTIVGTEGLTELDRLFLRFSEEFEKRFVGQGVENRSIDDTLDLGAELLGILPEKEIPGVAKAVK